MSDCEGIAFCPTCDKRTFHFLSGSATKGLCDECGADNENLKNVRVTFHQDAEEDYWPQKVED